MKPEAGMERFRIEVGKMHDTKPGNIVGAIANESGISGDLIGKIKIYEDFSTIDLPEGMPENTFNILKNIRISGQKIQLSKMTESYKKKDSKKKHRSKKRNKYK